MSNIFIVYDTNGNIIPPVTSNYPNVTPPQQLLVCDSTTPNASAAQANPGNYSVQNGQVISAVTIHISSSHVLSGVWDTYTLSVTTSDNSTHTVNLTIGGYVVSVTTPATYQVALHQSATNQQVSVVASGSGLISLTTTIGGSIINGIGLQTYKDTNGLLHVAPSGVGSKSYLSNYWTSQAVSSAYSTADTGTLIGMLLQTVYGDFWPALTGGASPLVSVDPNKKNSVADIQANLIPNIITTLESAVPVPSPTPTNWTASTAYAVNANVYPTTSNGFYYTCTTAGSSSTVQPTWPTTAGTTVVDGTVTWTCHAMPAQDFHYSHASRTFASTKQAMTNYANDIANIPNLA